GGRDGPVGEPGDQIRGGPRPPGGRERARRFRAVQARGLFFPLEPRDRHLGRGDAVRKGVRRAVALWSGRARERRKNRLARTLVVGYGGELAARFRDRRFLLAGAPQARRQGAESCGGGGRRKLDVGDEVVSMTMTTPAAFGRHPSSFEEGKTRLQDIS